MSNNRTIDGVQRRKVHHLKIHAGPFDDLVSGAKTGEVRKCDDREFQIGDSVELFLVDHTGSNATRSIVREITHIQRGYGLPDDLCVLSYAPAAKPKGEPVVFVEASELRNLKVSGFESFSGLLYRDQASMLCPQRVALYAEQPAPVADENTSIVPALVRNLEAVIELFTPLDRDCNRTLVDARACLDKVKELNPQR